jgi:uncharacterized protein
MANWRKMQSFAAMRSYLERFLPLPQNLAFGCGLTGCMVLSEGVSAFVGVTLGMWLHVLLLFTLFSLYLFVEQTDLHDFFLVLSLGSLLRVLSLTLPLRTVPLLFWYPMVGFPLLLAALLVTRFLKDPWRLLHVKFQPHGLWHLLVGLSGLPLGLIAYLILHPKPLIDYHNVTDVVLAILILAVFSGFLEEWIFRGLIGKQLYLLAGKTGLVLSAVLYASFYLGMFSFQYAFFMGLVGWFFAWWAQKEGTIWSVTLSHSLLVIGALIVGPLL